MEEPRSRVRKPAWAGSMAPSFLAAGDTCAALIRKHMLLARKSDVGSSLLLLIAARCDRLLDTVCCG